MKYLIKLSDGKYVEQFFKSSVCVTDKISSAGKYTFSLANKRLLNANLTAELIPYNPN